jgi:hypothetical protein
MAFELEALVGHLYVAGGRTIKTNPPGALCEVAPKRAARGREIETFFVLVLPSGNIAPNTFYEQMALMAAERYFSNTGSVTAALRDVYNTLNSNLYEHNSSGRRHYEANMITVVLRGTELFTARAGAATMILRYSGTNQTIPSPLTDEESLYKPPLGVQPMPDVEMTRFTVDRNTRMVLADANILEITDENITQALVGSNIERVLDDFRTLVTLQIQMMVVEFVPPEEPVAVAAATGQSSAIITAEIAASRARSINRDSEARITEAIAAVTVTRPDTPWERVRKRIREGLASVARTAGSSLTALGNAAGKVLGTEAPPAEKRRTILFMRGAVIGIPVIAIAVIMLSWVMNVGQTAYEECVGRAVTAGDFARSIANNAPTSVIAAWQGTLTIVSECEGLRPDVPDPTLQQIRLDAQTVIDQLNDIQRREPILIDAIPDANIREVLLQGLDLYAFDSSTNIIYRLQLQDDGLGLRAARQPIANMRTGARVEGNTIGTLIGIAFDEMNSRIVTLDTTGLLVSCRPAFINQCEAKRLLASETWVNPIRFAMWQGNVYVLDTGVGQLWRYEPTGGNYPSQPTEYFLSASRPNLPGALDFAIGSSGSGQIRGNVYVLYNDGTITAHRGGDPLPFTFANFREGQEMHVVTAQAMFLNDSPIDTGFYFASRPSRTIYETTAAGTWVATYRTNDEALFELLNDVAVDAEQGVIYAASGNSIFALQKRP